MKVKRYSQLTLLAVILLSTFFVWGMKYISFDHNLEKFFPAKDPETRFFQQYREKYENDNDFVLIGLVNEGGIFDQEFLLKTDSLTTRLGQIDLIESIISPTRIQEYLRLPLDAKLTAIPYLQIHQPEQYPQDSIRIFENPNLVDFLFSSDHQSLLIYVNHSPQIDEKQCQLLVDQINRVINDFNFKETHVAGKCFGQTFFINMLRNELVLFLALNFLMIIILLVFFYRSFWGVFLPLLIVGLSSLWTVGTMAWLGISLDMLTNIIPTILLVIGISDVVHLFTHYLAKRDKGMDKLEALKISIKQVGRATLITSLTTAIGFLSLATSSFSSLIEMGLFASIGLIYALFLTYTILPAVIILLPSRFIKLKSNPHSWKRRLSFSLEKVKQYRIPILWFSGFVFIMGLLGAYQLKVNNYLLGDIKAEHPQRQEFIFFEERFGGARPFEMEVTVKDDSLTIFSKEILLQLEKVDSFLMNQYGVKNLISPPIIIKQANQIYHAGRSRYYRIPHSESLLSRLERQILEHSDSLNITRFLESSQKKARISGKIPDWGTYIMGQKDDVFYEFLEKAHLKQKLDFHVTGTGYLMDLNNNYLIQNVLTGLAVAILIIGVLFASWFGSIKMFILTLIPNLLPLLFIAGIMGIFDISLKISTAIIFIISFGIAVDDSIHFLTAFKRELENNSVKEAIKNAYLTTGKAIIITSIILVGGFSILCFSDFMGTFYIGLLISLTLLMALVADLVLLPILLEKYYWKS